MEAPNHTITQHLEGFLLSARKLEDALGEEKKRSQKIAQEYLATRTTLENAVRELQNRLVQRENKIQAITQAYQTQQSVEARLKVEIRDISERERKSAADLAQYQSAWNEVLAREARARGAILESEKASKTVEDQRLQIKALEAKLADSHQNAAIHSRHAETYQRELQSALIRIQSSESKYNQIQKELAALSQSKRNADEEIARIELSMKERFRWELATEKEKLRAELEKDAALDRERFREITRNQLRSDLERSIGPERDAREAAEAELARIQRHVTEIDTKRNQEIERGRARLLAVTEENLGIKERLAAAQAGQAKEISAANDRADRAERLANELRNELAMHQLESGSTHIKIEQVRKESSKAMLIERLRHDDEVRDLRTKIDQLIGSGILAEKVEAAPSGMRIYSATPVSMAIARSNRDGNVVDHSLNAEENTSL